MACNNNTMTEDTATYVFKAFVTDQYGKIIENEDGIMCQVISDGEERVVSFTREVLESFAILPPTEDIDLGLDMFVGAPTNKGLSNAVIDEAGPSGSCGPSQAQDLDEKSRPNSEWGSADTKLLLDKYASYMGNIGPQKKFRNKKYMWTQISHDIEEILGIQRNPNQCENRYKTILKRKIKTRINNNTSGSTREDVEFEFDLNLIKSKDDSLEPEVLRGVGENKVSYKRSLVPPQLQQEPKKIRVREQSHAELLQKLHEEKEKNKEKRHNEKLALIRELFAKK